MGSTAAKATLIRPVLVYLYYLQMTTILFLLKKNLSINVINMNKHVGYRQALLINI